MKFTFNKGRKFWIEIEATEDGDMLDEKNKEVGTFIWNQKDKGSFKVTNFIIEKAYFKKDYLE